jgi:hypothetical protein
MNVIIVKYSEHILGSYLDKPIYKYLQDDKGGLYEFESIFVQKSNGEWATDHDGLYMVYNSMLYRHLSVLEE